MNWLPEWPLFSPLSDPIESVEFEDHRWLIVNLKKKILHKKKIFSFIFSSEFGVFIKVLIKVFLPPKIRIEKKNESLRTFSESRYGEITEQVAKVFEMNISLKNNEWAKFLLLDFVFEKSKDFHLPGFLTVGNSSKGSDYEDYPSIVWPRDFLFRALW